jgi:phenylalanyl-tRNA synthetase beta chain
MIISLNWLKKFTNIDVSIDELSTLIGTRLVEIENVIDLGVKYKDVLVVKVISADKLEGSDHLNVTKIDDGGTINNIERDSNGLIQVVCGAPNIKAGQLVAWLPPESIVPETFNKPEPLKLGIRNLRGTVSNGMIASGRELALSDDHTGILELDPDLTPGTSFTEAFELDDYLFDIENKSLTHRPDCFGIIGFAREVAAISGKEFKTPDWLLDLSTDLEINNSDIDLNVTIEDSKLCPRYTAIVMSGADSKKKSPLSIQTYLSRVGVRPINAVVDVTNYLMMLTGQPLHAFDYDKLVNLNDGKADIHVRSGRNDEKLELLDGRIINLTPDDIVIASGETVVGLAGAMGGKNTVIDDNTQKIIIESATFNLYKLRSTQMRHGIFSEAITRFTKGQPAELTVPVLMNAVQLMSEWSGAKCVSKLAEAYPDRFSPVELEIDVNIINRLLGSQFIYDKIFKTLRNVEFEIEQIDSIKMKAKVPYWRSDVHIIEDIAEEIGRLNGFDNINPSLPIRDFTAVKPSGFDEFRSNIRKILVRAGANEILTYSFINGDVLQKAGQDVQNSYRIVNSISPELQYCRQTLIPSLLGLINPNIRQGYDEFALFEINKTHQKKDGLTDENVPVEADMLALVVADKNQQVSASYYKAKRILDFLCQLLGLELNYVPIDDDIKSPLSDPFEYRRSARLINETTNSFIGFVGEYKKSVIHNFKLPDSTAGFEINLRELFDAVENANNRYSPISRYPIAERDICFKVSNSVYYKQIIDASNAALADILLDSVILPIDIYQSKDSETKNITIRIKLVSQDHTLTNDEVVNTIKSVTESVIAETYATVI